MAASYGQPDVVDVLIDAGAELETFDREGMTAVTLAASVGGPGQQEAVRRFV